MDHIRKFLGNTGAVLGRLDTAAIDRMIELLVRVREGGGRLFFLGAGGGAATASHAAADFRKICDFEAYAPTDNAAEYTARANDEGWETVFEAWLRVSRLGTNDALFVFSVGGGNPERGVSGHIVRAAAYARSVGAKVLGVVGRDGGWVGRHADAFLLVPTVDPAAVTPHVESVQVLILHLLVTDPRLKKREMKHESSGE